MVVNLSALSADAADAAVMAGGSVCAQFRRGRDGAVLHLAGAALAGLAACGSVHVPPVVVTPDECAQHVHVVPIDGPAGEVLVTLTDDGGLTVPGVLVTGRGPDGVVVQSQTDDDGNAVFRSMPAGRWEWLFEMQGFSPVTVSGMVDGSATHIMAEMGSEAEVGGIFVTERPVVNTTQTSMGTTLDAGTLSRVPR